MNIPKPAKYRRKPDKPKEPDHDFGYGFFYGDVPCKRCGRLLSMIEKTGAPCASNEAIELGKTFRRTL